MKQFRDIFILRRLHVVKKRISGKCALITMMMIVIFIIILPSAKRLSMMQNPKPSRVLCEEKHNIVFLKVHKTGSSSFANILQRFGLFKDLTFALPNKTTDQLRYNYFGGIGGTLNSTGIKPSKRSSKGYNILYNHVIFNKSAFLSEFPKVDYMYVTMLRDPIGQFISSLLFFRHEDIVTAAKKNITAYLKNPTVYEPKNPYVSFTDNRQALDLGLSPTKVRDLEAIISHIVMLDDIFDLILITEYFDESLIILKRRMCWHLKDILYLRKNAAYKSFDFSLSDTDKLNLKNWDMADHYIYEYFHGKFIGLLSNEPDIAEETQNYRRILNETRAFCTSREKRSFFTIKQTIWNPTFRVTTLDCVYMRLGELQFQTKLLQKSSV